MGKAIFFGMLLGLVVYFLSVLIGLKVHIGGDIAAAALAAAQIATIEERKRHHTL